MNAPRRWLDDPDADPTVRELLRGAPPAHTLDPPTRRRLGAKVARVSALPVAAAGWLFVKSATAALGVVLGTSALAVSAGVVEWRAEPAPAPAASIGSAVRQRKVPAPAQLSPAEARPEDEPSPPPAPSLNPTPTLPSTPVASSRLSDEAALLESARTQLREAPAAALDVTRQHAARFPRGQLASERQLIQIDALHRLGRDAEARSLARQLLRAGGANLYADRVRQLLGEDAAH